jgi:hypothetical protein
MILAFPPASNSRAAIVPASWSSRFDPSPDDPTKGIRNLPCHPAAPAGHARRSETVARSRVALRFGLLSEVPSVTLIGN